MTQATNPQLADIDYAIDLARNGAEAPLLGGPIGLMWTGLSVPALLLHGSVLAGWTDLPESQVGLVWAAYGLVGTVLSVWLGKRIDAKPAAGSFCNRVADALWTSAGVLVATLAISAVLAVTALGAPDILFAFIVPFAFGLSTVANAVLSKVTGQAYLKWAAWSAGAATAVCTLTVARPEMFFLAGAFVFLSGVLPSWLELRREREFNAAASA